MRQKHIDNYIAEGRKVRAVLARYDRDLMKRGYVICKTTWLDSHGNHRSRTDYRLGGEHTR